MIWLIPTAIIGGLLLVVGLFLAICFRVVVPTNDVHIVQSGRRSIPYGKDLPDGNVYYKWPSWVPRIGVKTTVFPVSVFDVALDGYAAYDKGRVPFQVDIMAFFRICEPEVAAQRVSEFGELKEQLSSILQGAVRKILASSEIETILEGRSEFGEQFTQEVDGQLKEWGVGTVKSIELMDIRDAQNSKVISNIMAKKSSHIEMESRVAVAENTKNAQMKEIDAKREVEVGAQQARQQLGLKTAETDRDIGIANEQTKQLIQEQAANTAEKTMAVKKIETVRQAEINRDVEIVTAEQEKKTAVIKAEGHKQQTTLIAEGNLEAKKREAEGITLEGQAKASAEEAILLAPVTAQTTLAKEIGENISYQEYLITIRKVEAQQAVGIANAKSLEGAEIKVIANASTPQDGLAGVGKMLTPDGGFNLGSAIEAFGSTEAGAAIINRLITPPATKK